MRLSSQSPMGYFFVNIPFTQTPNPLYWSYYILLYLYIYAQFALSFALQSTFFMEVDKVIGQGKESPSERKKINGMDLIKYIPYIRATPQSLLKRTEGLLTIKKNYELWSEWCELS